MLWARPVLAVPPLAPAALDAPEPPGRGSSDPAAQDGQHRRQQELAPAFLSSAPAAVEHRMDTERVVAQGAAAGQRHDQKSERKSTHEWCPRRRCPDRCPSAF